MRTLKYIPVLAALLLAFAAGAVPQEPSLPQMAPAASLKPARARYAAQGGEQADILR